MAARRVVSWRGGGAAHTRELANLERQKEEVVRKLGQHGRGWAPDPRPLDVAGTVGGQDGAMW